MTHKLYRMVCHGTLDILMKSLSCLTLSKALLASRAETDIALLRCVKQLLSASAWTQHWHQRLFKNQTAKNGCV